MGKITRTTKIAAILKDHPKAAQCLAEKYHFYCFYCFAASLETLEQGLASHGMSKKEIDQLIDKLNQLNRQNTGPQKKLGKKHY